MASRRRGDDLDRRGYREADRDPSRGEPSRAPKGGRPSLNEFFVDGQGIHREVLQREICKYLGPEAHSRPSIYNGVKGYTITAVRPFTPKMLDDLMDLSDAYASENREMTRKGHQGISYEESRTSQHQDAILRQGQGPQDMYTQDRYPPSDPYTMASAQAGYPALSTSTYPPSQGYPAAYPPDPGFAQASAYGAPYQIPGGRPAPNNDYGYGGESPRRDQYGQPVAYQNSVRRGDPRVDPGKSYPGPDSRERVDREPRNLDPRIPSSYTASTGGYTSVYSPGNVDPGYDDYVSAAPRTQSSRPVDPYQQSRPAPAGYDPRDPRYRPEPFREEPRRTGGRR